MNTRESKIWFFYFMIFSALYGCAIGFFIPNFNWLSAILGAIWMFIYAFVFCPQIHGLYMEDKTWYLFLLFSSLCGCAIFFIPNFNWLSAALGAIWMFIYVFMFCPQIFNDED